MSRPSKKDIEAYYESMPREMIVYCITNADYSKVKIKDLKRMIKILDGRLI